jgi:AraC family transcriptional regulator
LEQAAYLLKYTKSRSITDIAFSLGFGSSTAFSRAFKHHFACTPGQIRKGFLGDVKKKSEEFLKANKPDGITGFKIERLNEIRVFVRRYVGTYQNFAVQKEWCLHIKDAKSRGYITPKSRYFGIMYNDPECSDEGRCRYDCCISVETAIKEKVKVIPAGQYALFTVVATIADDPFELFQWIYGTWLPASGYEVCDTESYNDYYSFSVEEDTGKFHEQIQYRICLPVVKYVKSSRNMSNRR